METKDRKHRSSIITVKGKHDLYNKHRSSKIVLPELLYNEKHRKQNNKARFLREKTENESKRKPN